MHPGAHAITTPDKPAYVMARSGRIVTYRELEESSNRIAHLLRKLGLRPGDSIAVMMENNPAFFAICWAAQRSGLQYTAASSRLTVGELEYIINDCEAKAFFTSYEKRELATAVRSLIPDVTGAYVVDGAVDGYVPLEAAMQGMPTTPIDDECEGGDMLYSSGTTGRPKGVKTKLTLAPMGTAPSLYTLTSMLYGFNPEMRYLSPAPLYHAAPLRYCMTVMRAGGTVVVMEHFDPEEALQLIEKYRITHAQWVPTMFVRMLKLDGAVRAKYDVSSLENVVHAAAPCPIPVKEQMIAWWGPKIHEYYAGTEGNGFCAINSTEWLAKKGSVGRALLGEVHICGDDGEELPIGEAGTIYFGNGADFEYHNDPEKTASSRHPKGWSTLGDIGYLDADGFLFLTDRKANMIISGGVNIYPQEAENVLTMHAKVADVAVFGVPNEDFGEEVKGVVQPAEWSDVDTPEKRAALERELIAFCRSRLADIKCPRSIDFEADLPRHPTGKLYKRLLRDRYWEGRASKLV
jgi:long-chain acyl-CoA synthetase